MNKALFVLLLCAQSLIAQWDIGIETQVYPTGIIPGLSIDRFISDHSVLNFRVGHQIIDHRDLGVHLNEEGIGWGFSLGYKTYIRPQATGWHWAIRSDVWFNSLDWVDVSPLDLPFGGHSDIIVLQPTMMIGHAFPLPAYWILSPAISFGWEWNIHTQGEPTGQGAIILFGLTIAKRI